MGLLGSLMCAGLSGEAPLWVAAVCSSTRNHALAPVGIRM
jgi:hypothetical protein